MRPGGGKCLAAAADDVTQFYALQMIGPAHREQHVPSDASRPAQSLGNEVEDGVAFHLQRRPRMGAPAPSRSPRPRT